VTDSGRQQQDAGNDQGGDLGRLQGDVGQVAARARRVGPGQDPVRGRRRDAPFCGWAVGAAAAVALAAALAAGRRAPVPAAIGPLADARVGASADNPAGGHLARQHWAA
jgi:hypothetical protein